jgi:hypothetical protein
MFLKQLIKFNSSDSLTVLTSNQFKRSFPFESSGDIVHFEGLDTSMLMWL